MPVQTNTVSNSVMCSTLAVFAVHKFASFQKISLKSRDKETGKAHLQLPHDNKWQLRVAVTKFWRGSLNCTSVQSKAAPDMQDSRDKAQEACTKGHRMGVAKSSQCASTEFLKTSPIYL